jgi:hypothetical protein
MEENLKQKQKEYDDLGKNLASVRNLSKNVVKQLEAPDLTRQMKNRLEMKIKEYREVSFYYYLF